MSAKPIFQALPNPYDDRFQGFYNIVEQVREFGIACSEVNGIKTGQL